MRRRLTFGGVLLAFGLLGTTLLAPAAAAATVNSADPAGDGHGAGDLRAQRVWQSQNLQVSFQVRTQLPFNPEAAAWTGENAVTSLRFNIAVDGGNQIDYVLLVHSSNEGPVTEIYAIAHSPAPRFVCTPGATFPQPTMVRVTLTGPECIGDAESIRVFSRLWFDKGGNGTIDSDDRAPNSGFSPVLQIDETH